MVLRPSLSSPGGAQRLTRLEFPCPLCASDDRDRLFVSRLYSDEVPVVRCRACGLLYQSPRPRDEDLGSMYDEKYYTGRDAKAGDYTYADERAKEPEVRLKAAARLARIETLVKPGRLVAGAGIPREWTSRSTP